MNSTPESPTIENLSNMSNSPNSVSQNVVMMPTFSGVITEKLTRSNYVLWLAQILPWLKGRNLMGFVNSKNPCPPEFLLDTQGNPTTMINPEHGLWIQQDQMVLGTITSLVTTSILGTIARKSTSAETWKALEKHFACTSQHHVQQLMSTLYQTTRGESSISEFLDRVNHVADLLALFDQPIPES